MKLFKIEDHNEFRAKDGKKIIYLLKYKGENLYVGQTVELKCRARWHRSSYTKKEFDEIYYYFCDESEANNEEAASIVKYNPKINGNLPPNDAYISAKKFMDQLLCELKTNHESYNFSYIASRWNSDALPYIDANKLEDLKQAFKQILNK